MRRSRLDIRLGEQLRIGQRWRRRHDGTVWRIRQVHRPDCMAVLEGDGGTRLCLRFADMRKHWERTADASTQEAA